MVDSLVSPSTGPWSLFPQVEDVVRHQRRNARLAEVGNDLPPVVGGVVGRMEEDVAYGIGEGLPLGGPVGDDRLRVDRLQDIQRSCVVRFIDQCALLKGMLLLDAIFFDLQDPGIPYLVGVQHMAEQWKTPVRQVGPVHPEFFDQLLVEVMVVREDVFEEGGHNESG